MLLKGSFQVSLSMIIGVVFAVIILGLSISWITGTFSGITSVSDSAIQVAKSQILKGNVDKAAVIPAKEKMRADEKIEIAVIVMNNKATPQNYYIAIVPSLPEYRDYFSIIPAYARIIDLKPDESDVKKFNLVANEEYLQYLQEIGGVDYVDFEVFVCEDQPDLEAENLEDICESIYKHKSFIMEITLEG